MISGAFHVVREPPFVTIVSNGDRPRPPDVESRVGDAFEWSGTQYSTTVTNRLSPSIAGGRSTQLSARCVGGTLGIRGFQAGDRMDIEGGVTPVKELLRAAGVPNRLRPYSPVATVDGRIAAVIGIRVASWARPVRDEAVVTIERGVSTWK